MSEASLEWQGDFGLDSTGDLALADGDVATRQRLERRLFTPQRGYVWHPDYGAGLPQKIGEPIGVSAVKAIVTSQVYMEESVAPYPPVQITVGASPNEPDNIGIGIKYWDAVTGVAVSFTITV